MLYNEMANLNASTWAQCFPNDVTVTYITKNFLNDMATASSKLKLKREYIY
jgi:hypothetical protein